MDNKEEIKKLLNVCGNVQHGVINFEKRYAQEGISCFIAKDEKNENDQTKKYKKVNLLNVKQEDYDWLEENLLPSYFAYHNEKVTNEKVRNSRSTKQFILELDFCSLKKSLFPKKKVDFTRYKFNYYRQGCHFDVHTDTKKGENHIGTLILIPPTKFIGGSIKFPSLGDKIIETNVGKNAAFTFLYFDISLPHAIEEITSGNRISIIYNVYDKSAGDQYDVVKENILDTNQLNDIIKSLKTYYKNKKNIVLIPGALYPELETLVLENFNFVKTFYDSDYKFPPEEVYEADMDRIKEYDDLIESEYTDFYELLQDHEHVKYVVSEMFLDKTKLIKDNDQVLKYYIEGAYTGNSPTSESCELDYSVCFLLNPDKDYYNQPEQTDENPDVEETKKDERTSFKRSDEATNSAASSGISSKKKKL